MRKREVHNTYLHLLAIPKYSQITRIKETLNVFLIALSWHCLRANEIREKYLG